MAEADGAPWAHWGYATLRLAEPWRAGRRPARFLQAGGDARLILEDDADVREIFAHARHLQGGRDRDLRPKLIAGMLMGVALFLAVAAVAIDFGAPRIAKWAVTPEAARTLGEQLARAMVGPPDDGDAYCRDEAATAALETLTARLLAAIDAPQDLIQVDVANLGLVNAFALPGGRVLLLRGLIEDADSSEAVAGVLAHEIGHVLERHPVEGLSRAMGVQLVVLLLAPGVGVDLAGQAALSSYSRAAEMEADEWAMRILTAAEIDTRPLGAFFAKLAEEDQDRAAWREENLSRLLATHPDTAERAKRFTRPGGAAMSAEEWSVLKTACEGMAAPRAPFRGVF